MIVGQHVVRTSKRYCGHLLIELVNHNNNNNNSAMVVLVAFEFEFAFELAFELAFVFVAPRVLFGQPETCVSFSPSFIFFLFDVYICLACLLWLASSHHGGLSLSRPVRKHEVMQLIMLERTDQAGN